MCRFRDLMRLVGTLDMGMETRLETRETAGRLVEMVEVAMGRDVC
jgi:hypothetical protein